MAAPQPQPHTKIDTCNACGKLIPHAGMRLCASCALVEENRFELVREFVKAHDGAAVPEIAHGTGVSASDVRRFMEGGRLVSINGGLSTCTCGGVGTRCRSCRAQLTQTFREMEATMHREAEERQDRPYDQMRHGRRKRLGESG